MKVLHVIARVNLGGTARWLETLTVEQVAAGQEVVVATGHVQGDEIEDPGAATMPLVRLDRLGRAVSPFDDLVALRELRDLIGDLQPDVVNTHTAKAGMVGRVCPFGLHALPCARNSKPRCRKVPLRRPDLEGTTPSALEPPGSASAAPCRWFRSLVRGRRGARD